MAGIDILRTTLAALLADTPKPYASVRALMSVLTRSAQIYCGTVTGTTAVIAVDVPGDPKFVIVVNTNDRTMGVKIYGMATLFAVKLNATGPAITYADQIISLGTGIFTIGTDAQLNTAHTLSYIALI